MRAALLLAATTVVANAGSSWRSDGAMPPPMAISPRFPKSPARVRAPNLCTPTLAAPAVCAPAEGTQQNAARARATHRHATATCWPTLQQYAAEFQRVSQLPAMPAHKLHLCCAVAHCPNPWHNCTRTASARTHTSARTCTFRASGIGLRGLETRDEPKHPRKPTTPPLPPPLSQRTQLNSTPLTSIPIHKPPMTRLSPTLHAISPSFPTFLAHRNHANRQRRRVRRPDRPREGRRATPRPAHRHRQAHPDIGRPGTAGL